MGVGGQHHVYYAENTALIYADRPSTACPNKFWILLFFCPTSRQLEGTSALLSKNANTYEFFLFFVTF